MARVVVGLSGGVDSSVTALLLQQQGHEVIGVYMRNWNEESVSLNNECPWIEDSHDAMMVASQLGIPFQVLDMAVDYKARIVDYMFAEYERGRTPNPDVLCNREIKFDLFLKTALELGADAVATGHYVRRETRKEKGTAREHLLSGLDPGKDQSYFLCQLSEEQLSKALFPIGDLQKSEVRRLAAEAGLLTATKKDSQGLCFIGKVRLPDFLQQQLAPKPGEIIEIADLPERADSTLDEEAQPWLFAPEMGRVVGEHNGAHFYTVGQRKGLRVGGKAEPLFVLGTDVEYNRLYVGMGEAHPGLYRRALRILPEEVHWIRPDEALAPGEERELMVRHRYRQPLQRARLIAQPNGLFVRFDKRQKAITPGQFAAFYAGDELIGSGVIHA